MVAINWSNVTDLGQMPSLANTASDGLFWVGMLHMLWIILLLVLIGYGFEVALMVASFLSLILALVLVYSGAIGWAYVAEFVGILLFMFLYIIWSGKKN
jgi:hypothetical protein